MGFPNAFPRYLQDETAEYLRTAKKKTILFGVIFLCGFLATLIVFATIEEQKIEKVLKPTHADYLGLLEKDPTCECTNAVTQYSKVYSYPVVQDPMCAQFEGMALMCSDQSDPANPNENTCYNVPNTFFSAFWVLDDTTKRPVGVSPGGFIVTMRDMCRKTKGMIDYFKSIFDQNLITSERLLRKETMEQLMGTKLNETLASTKGALYSVASLGQRWDKAFPFEIGSNGHLVHKDFPNKNLYKSFCDCTNCASLGGANCGSCNCDTWYNSITAYTETKYDPAMAAADFSGQDGYLMDFSTSGFPKGWDISTMIIFGFISPDNHAGTLDYKAYYSSCSPKFCEYHVVKKKNAAEVVVALFGLYAGILSATTVFVTVLWKLLCKEEKGETKVEAKAEKVEREA